MVRLGRDRAGPDGRALPGAGQGARHGDGPADLRGGAGRLPLQHRRGRGRRRQLSSASTASTTSRTCTASGRSSTSGPATSATRSSTPSVGKVGVYICYDRHFPEGWRALGLNGAQIVFNPSATSPRPVVLPVAARAAGRRRGQRVLRRRHQPGRRRGRWATTTSTARATSSTRTARCVGDVGDAHKPELIVRDLDLDLIPEVRNRWAFYRDRRPDAYQDLVRP